MPPLLRSNALSHVQPPHAGGQPMRPTRPTGLVPAPLIDDALNVPTTPLRVPGASKASPCPPLPPSLPGWPGVAVKNRSAGELGKGGGQGKKSTSVSEFLSSPPPAGSAGYLR